MTPRQAGLLGLLAGAAFAQQPVQPPQASPPALAAAHLPADWAERDLEGKWVAYRAGVDRDLQPASSAAAWAQLLAGREEFELLEWIAVYEGWRHAGPLLGKADAPQLLRVAVWNLGALDSHNKDTAQKALLQRPGAALAWFERHPEAQTGRAAELFATLRNGGHAAADAGKYLPPLDPVQLLVPWLDAPAQLAEFGDRRTADPKVRYVHQVLRALGGVLVHGDTDDLVVAKVTALAKHGHPAVRAAAFTTLSKLPAGCVPFETLLRWADDAGLEASRRELAVTVLSYSSHPLAFRALHRIAADGAHPGRDAAVLRLGEVGDHTTLDVLHGLGAEDPALRRRAADAMARIERRRGAGEFLQAVQLRLLLLRIAYARAMGEESAAALLDSTEQFLRPGAPGGSLRAVMDPFLQVPAPPSPFRGEQAARIEAELRRVAEALAAR